MGMTISIDWNSLVTAAVGGLIVGIVVLIVEYIVRRREKKGARVEQQIVRFSNEERKITGSIFNFLGPGSSIDLMKSELGPANKKGKEIGGLFSKETDSFQLTPEEIEPEGVKKNETARDSYLYFFKNASVKITSKDGQTIDSLTVIATDTDIAFSDTTFLDSEEERFLGVATITTDIIEGCNAEEFTGCRDCFTGVHKIIGNPFWIHVTYFCDFAEYDVEKNVTQNPEHLIGSVINGICLSSELDTVTYIFTYDL